MYWWRHDSIALDGNSWKSTRGNASRVAILIHGYRRLVQMLEIEHPGFTLKVSAILLLASFAMWVIGILLAKQVVKLLRVPATLFMPVVAVLCLIGSYALGLKVFNLYLMIPMGILSYYLTDMGYPLPPLVIGVILGGMADANLRRGLMVSQGSLAPFFTRPVALILLIVIVLTFVTNTSMYRNFTAKFKKHKGEK